MPNRIIKESIRTSETVASLSDFEFRVWIGLIVSADDAGRGDARPAIIKGSVFPLQDDVTAAQITDALLGLSAKGCVGLYEVDGKPYYWFPTWNKHQRVRDVKPKFPEPPSAANCGSLPQFAATRRSSPQIAADCGDSPPRACAQPCAGAESNPIQSNTNPNPIQSESESKRAREAAFDMFWKAYPKKVGKQAALKAFQRVKVPLESLLTAIERQKCGDQWSRDNGRYIPNPATWLNEGRWDDEDYNPKVKKYTTEGSFLDDAE